MEVLKIASLYNYRSFLSKEISNLKWSHKLQRLQVPPTRNFLDIFLYVRWSWLGKSIVTYFKKHLSTCNIVMWTCNLLLSTCLCHETNVDMHLVNKHVNIIISYVDINKLHVDITTYICWICHHRKEYQLFSTLIPIINSPSLNISHHFTISDAGSVYNLYQTRSNWWASFF